MGRLTSQWVMTPEEEIKRIKQDYKTHWHRLENHPEVQMTLAKNDPVRLGEIAVMLVYGNYYDASVARDSRHKIVVFENHEPMGFDSADSAKRYIAHMSSDPTVHISHIMQKVDDRWEETSL
jgi:hypothetical protein